MLGVQGNLLRSIRRYMEVLFEPVSTDSYADLLDRSNNFTVPLQLSESISKVSTVRDLICMVSDFDNDKRLARFLLAWAGIHLCLEDTTAGPACECPFVYFFVKYALDHGMGVPKPALAVYDKMNMQLSREFIRCAYPTCELNRLDQSTGQVKFKKCSRCQRALDWLKRVIILRAVVYTENAIMYTYRTVIRLRYGTVGSMVRFA